MSSIEFIQPDPRDGGTRVVIDGVEMQRSITSATVEFPPGGTESRVTLKMMFARDVRLCMKDARIIMDDATASMLERHGWTRPTDGQVQA